MSIEREGGKGKPFYSMPIFHWKKQTDTTDPVILKNELLDDLRTDLVNAIRNNNPSKIALLKRDIETVEKWKV